MNATFDIYRKLTQPLSYTADLTTYLVSLDKVHYELEFSMLDRTFSDTADYEAIKPLPEFRRVAHVIKNDLALLQMRDDIALLKGRQ